MMIKSDTATGIPEAAPTSTQTRGIAPGSASIFDGLSPNREYDCVERLVLHFNKHSRAGDAGEVFPKSTFKQA